MDAARISALLAMDPGELVRHLQTCRLRELKSIERLGLVCRCEPFREVYRRWPAARRRQLAKRLGVSQSKAFGRACGRQFVLCHHADGPTLPPEAAAVLLARLWPAEYAEPPLDRSASGAATPGECLSSRLKRAGAGVRLWHPGDAQQSGREALPDEVGIAVSGMRSTPQGMQVVELGKVDVRKAS